MRPSRGITAALAAFVSAIAFGPPLTVGAAAPWQVSPAPFPTPANPDGDNLYGVACATPVTCLAVGGTFAEQWDGHAWRVVTFPPAAPGATYTWLNSITCPGPTTCLATGSWGDGTREHTALETWDGRVWSATPVADVGVALGAITCSSTSFCVAVGTLSGGSSPVVIRLTGGTWQIDHPPGSGRLSGVSCPSPSFCIAVGATSSPQRLPGMTPLVEAWNGSTWSESLPPNEPPPPYSGSPTYGSQFNTVACSSASSCVAGGTESAPISLGCCSSRPMAEAWNGSSWTVTPVPVPSNPHTGSPWTVGDILGLTCITSTSCLAVGDWGFGNGGVTLLDSWNGSAWSVVGSPNPGTVDNGLFNVTCPGALDCFAVGGQLGNTGSYEPLILRQPSPIPLL